MNDKNHKSQKPPVKKRGHKKLQEALRKNLLRRKEVKSKKD